MKKELPKAYEPLKYEDGIYKKWEKSGLFNPDNLSLDKKAKGYTISMPPPNVTGTLHMGHAVMLAIEDILTRYHRMKGERALWVPGTDHAAIATQTKVEKLLKEKGQDRHKLGREKFLKEVNKFAQKSHDTIENQIKKMGSSCDWSREAYTLDKVRTKAVRTVFKMMYDDGLIYRGERIVNWCPRCHSTLADDEVEYKAQKAKLYTFKYSTSFPFTIATTRPETKLGDTAVAVNPKDKRYKKYIGKTYEVDFLGIKLNLKIIADREVDMNFGTGALGVTPAHSSVDWQMAEENNLKKIKVIDESGNIREGFDEFSGKNVFAARKEIVKKLKEEGLLEKEEEVDNNLSLCYRCDTPIEPLPSLQWFIDVHKKIKRRGNKSIKELSIEAVKKGVFGRDKIKIVPERFEKEYFRWMENLRDWCISRQIWFGHQVPVWYKTINNEQLTINNNKEEIHVGVEAPEDKTNFVFLHGFKRTNKVIDPLTWLNKELHRENNFCEVLPNPDKPERKEQTDFVLKNAKINESTVIVTHSLGGILALKLLEENNIKIKKLVMIAPGYNPATKELLNYKGNDFDFDKINKLVKEVVIFSDLNDHVIRQEDNKIYTKKMPNVKFISMEAPVSHFNCLECSEILNELKKGIWVQDEDTLDTWFSSGLWTFSTLASSPGEIKVKDGKIFIDSEDFKNFHPTSVLETGYDILFFWIARMIIMTTYAVGDIPFQDVYLHGLVRDEKGKKMSKSLGNVIDPLDMIKKYGTDATRLSLVIGTTPGNDMNLSEEKVAGFRNFANKLWNISRYIISNCHSEAEGRRISGSAHNVEKQQMSCKPRSFTTLRSVQDDKLTLADKWILDSLEEVIEIVSKKLNNYEFSVAGEMLKDFTWNNFADWYLEVSKFEKSEEKDKILIYVLENLLKLWHPFMPFVTEKIWEEMGSKKMLIIEEWPKFSRGRYVAGGKLPKDNFNKIKNIITAIRNARAENKVEPAKKIKVVIYAGKNKKLIESQAHLIKNLRTGISELEILEKGEKIKDAIYITVGEIEIYLVGARDEKKEKERIKKEIDNLEKIIKAAKVKLDNKDFVNKAPEKVVNMEKEKLEKAEGELKKLVNK